MISLTTARMLSELCPPKLKRSVNDRVALVSCSDYGQFEQQLGTALDSIGDVKKLVHGKTVAVKVNLAGDPRVWPSAVPGGEVFRTNPQSVRATISLLVKAGARRIRILESFFPASQEHSLWARYHLRTDQIHHKGVPIIWENIQNLGNHKHYVRRKPCNPLVYPAYHLSPALFQCDVYVSMAKLKQHWLAGVTMSMKNNFGITPCSLYGGDCGRDGNEQPRKERADVLHNGIIPVPAGVDAELDPNSPRDPGFRVPRIVVDLLQVRPIDLAIVDGVDTLSGGEGPWIPGIQQVHPGIIIVGRNAVNTDAVGTAVLGYDPLSERGEPPFVRSDNTLRLADEALLGTCDVRKIDLVGLTLDDARTKIRIGQGEGRRMVT
ncbi:DUF362 domain-containing protein [Occallatibacter savannae]|uniref:DUF362 domain-containing protein n=1 Tax=Occallatibacter savannae TaxID=1002691 RepID=UPI0013A56AA0|nr:DUF362 domain-containing protein [Occallatibacter savannae]